PGLLQPGLAELARGVADHAGEGVRGIHAVWLAVLVAFVPRQADAVAVGDLAAKDVAGGRDDRRIIRRPTQVLGFDDLPVAGAQGEAAEGETEDQRDAAEGSANSDSTARPGRRRARDRIGVRIR